MLEILTACSYLNFDVSTCQHFCHSFFLAASKMKVTLFKLMCLLLTCCAISKVSTKQYQSALSILLFNYLDNLRRPQRDNCRGISQEPD